MIIFFPKVYPIDRYTEIKYIEQGCPDFRCIGSTFAILILTRSTSNKLSNYCISFNKHIFVHKII